MARKIYIARDITHAGIVRGMLETNGIAVTVRGADLFGVRGMIPIAPDTAPSLWVEESDYERAKALIEAAEEPRPDAAPWSCRACSETVDPELGQCWRCGALRE